LHQLILAGLFDTKFQFLKTMTEHFKLCIVIPCFNEEKRLDINRFQSFLKAQPSILICFVNDGSTDKTFDILKAIKNKYANNVEVFETPKNGGKAEAVRLGVLHCNANYNFEKIAYLDADLATSLEECVEISKLVKNETLFAFGSRIKKIDTNIDRKGYRFLIGRFIATLISRQLNLPVYDTQCGCKIIETKLSKKLFNKKFISKWLFDVELFHRISEIYGIDGIKKISKEVPLKSWVDIGESKVQFSYFFKLWYDLFSIKKAYKKH